MGAFAAGSCRKVSTSVYAILVVAVVFAYVMIQVLVLTFAKEKVSHFFEWVFHATSLSQDYTPTQELQKKHHCQSKS
jgi:ABC-type lipoprotein release transport system permease subunit